MANNMNNLATLIKRLEAATSRLEDMVPQFPESSVTNGVSSTDKGPSSGGGAQQPERTLASPPPAAAPLPASIDDFDALINGEVTTFVAMSEQIGGLLAEQSAALLRAFAAQRKFLIVTTKARKPDIQSPSYREILKELQEMMGSVNDIRETNRGSSLFNHLSAVSEGVSVLGWITVEPKPADYVTEILGSTQFYGNRVIKEYKEKDRAHVEWAQAFYQIFKSLSAYVKQHYPSGVTWNKDGIDAVDALKEVQSGQTSAKPSISSPSAGPGAPPPPPLPNFDNAPPPPPMPSGGASKGGASDMGAVFDQISQGESVTSHLRKVDPSSQTHKNPSLRTTSAVPSAPSRSSSQTSNRGKSPLPGKKPKPESMRTKKPARKDLDGNKWIVENFDHPSEVIELTASITQSILISRCAKTTIRVHGKGNAITLDNCTAVSLVVDSLVSSVDVIKSPKFEMQVLGSLPTIMLDQVDGAAVYLSRDSLGTEVFTSLCTGINIVVPGRTDDDDFVEKPLPEQMKSVIRNGQLVSEIVEHAG
ncbi:MAG: hypothetical protein Q9191_003367 [Dirinaria sp. TL-2023a]